MTVLLVVLGGFTLALWFDQGLSSSFVAPELDVAINVSATLVAGAVAILGWVRWLEQRESTALFESSAFLMLMSTNLLTVGAVLIGHPEVFGLDAPDVPGRGSLGAFLWTLARLGAAIVLVVGAVRAIRRERPRLPPLIVVFLPATSVLVIGITAPFLMLPLPSLVRVSEPLVSLGLGNLDLPGTATAFLQIASCALFFMVALLYRRLYRRDARLLHAFLATGLLVAGFSQLHFALEPTVTAGTVTAADVLRVLSYGILFFGIEAQAQADAGQLRRANSELERLRELEAANAVLAERSRLAREVHDGLAQDLWFAKLLQARIAQDESVDEGTRSTAREVLAALDIALADARQAVMALRTAPDAGSSLEQVLASYVDDFGERFGLRSAFEVVDRLPTLPPRTEAEVLRIIQEALNNVGKHADATIVRVQVETLGRHVRFTVIDNGRGFEPDAVDEGRFGVRSMHERAQLVGGRLDINSRRSEGTRVILEVPAERGPEQ